MREFHRDRLLARLRVRQPRLVLLTAPAGFGKSTLAQQFAREFSRYAMCDCAQVRGERALCRHFIAARAAVSERGESAWSQLQYGLVETDLPSAADIETALQAWSAPGEPALFIFDNVEQLAGRHAERKLFERLLARSPPTASIVVCSRKPILLHTSKIAPPHRIITLRAADLTFDRAEIQALCEPFGLSSDRIDDIERITRGWPIGVLTLCQFAIEGRLETSLARLDDVAFDEMRAYLVDEVFETLSSAELAALIACAAMRGASADDVAAALEIDDAHDLMARLLDVSPFVSQVAGTATSDVHPLLQAAIRSRYRRRCRIYALNAARAYEARGLFVRAARIYHEIGDLDATARLLAAENTRPDRKQSIEYSTLIASLDAPTLARYPIVRGLSTYGRRFRVDPHVLRDEIAAIWSSIPLSADFELRCNIGNPLARIMYETGRLHEAEALLRLLEWEVGGIPPVPRTAGEAYIARTLGCIYARAGRLGEAERYMSKGYFTVPGAERVTSRYLIERALIEGLHGRPEVQARLADQAIEAALSADMSVHIACSLAEAAFGAWFRGEDERFIGYVRRLDERVVAEGLRGFAHFCSAAYAVNEAEPNGTEQPNWLACAHLIAAANRQGERRIELAAAAKAAADESNDVFLRLVANLTLALLVPSRRQELSTDALMCASSIEAEPPQAALTAFIAGDTSRSLLTPLIARFRAGVALAAVPVEIDVGTCEIRRGGAVIPLSERERALLVALARQRRAYSRRELAALLWPDLADDGAREALNSCLYRVRGHLSEDIVTHGRDGYRLRDDVRVDLREIEHWVAVIVPRRALSPHDMKLLLQLYRRLRSAQRPAGDAWEWLEPVIAQLDDMRRAIGERLANEALAARRFGEALEIGRQLVDDDTCDEAARALVIRAHLGLGNEASAIRELRAYRVTLRRELDTEPSAELLQLVRRRAAGSAPVPTVAAIRT